VGRILAIDFGLKRTGLAVTDPERLIATALETVETAGLYAYLEKYIGENDVDEIVVGEPRRWDNSPSGPVAETERMIAKIRAGFGLPVARADERFTSVLAARAIAQSGVKRSKRRDKGLVDRVSAVLILQSYLDRRKEA